MTSLLRLIVVFCLLFIGLSPASAKIVPDSKEQITLSFAPVVKQSAPAVVNIYTERRVRTASPLLSDPLFEQFFGRSRLFEGLNRDRVVNSLGSGVIVTNDGVVITNSHVVDGATEIKVVLSDRREYKATKILDDKRTDLTLLKIEDDKRTFPFFTFADSDVLEVGDLVLAIGNPFGVGQTVTSGIISALARTDVGISDYEFFIQTDAAINPGNSGGALVNMQGELVGVNTAIFSKSGASHGIGFATPSNMVKTLVKSHQTGGKLVRPWLGAATQNITQEIAESLGLDVPTGVLVRDVFDGSTADISGLKRGDIIVEADGNPIHDEQSLKYRIATKYIGDEMRLKVLRDNKPYKVVLTLSAPIENPPRNTTLIKEDGLFAGMTVMNLSPAVAHELGSSRYEGVIVSNIATGSQAKRLVRVGDIIENINGANISRVEDVIEAAKNESRTWKVTLLRGNQRVSVSFSY